MYLDTVVEFINAQLKLRMGAKASHSRFYGICKFVTKDIGGGRAVVLYDNAGNDQVVIDDSQWLICYHRFLGWTFAPNEQNQQNSYGDGASTKLAFANFVMGVYGSREFLDMTDQELTASISFNFPDVFPQSLVNGLNGLKQCIISPLSTNNNTAGESERIEVAKEDIFFTLNYRAAIVGDVTCLADCEPNCI